MSFAHPHPANHQDAVAYQPVQIGDVWFLQRASDEHLAAFNGLGDTAYGRVRIWNTADQAIHFRDRVMPSSTTMLWVPRP